MAGGWYQDGAVQAQIDASVEDAVKRARATLATGESHTHCVICEAPIPERRRAALPGVKLCVPCQREEDALDAAARVQDRRGNKDSQLR